MRAYSAVNTRHCIAITQRQSPESHLKGTLLKGTLQLCARLLVLQQMKFPVILLRKHPKERYILDNERNLVLLGVSYRGGLLQ